MSFRRVGGLLILGIVGLGCAFWLCAPDVLAADKSKDSKVGAKGKTGSSSKKTETDEKSDNSSNDDADANKKVVKTDAEWRKQLTALQFRVARKKGTEKAGTGKYAHTKKDGIYRCVCCGQPLFDSKTKFESGTGWPSFFQAINDKAVNYIDDNSEGELRTEVECSRCDAHLGHVFADGPPPTGRRYCMNSASLHLVTREAFEKELKAKEAKSKAGSGEKGAKDKEPAEKDK